MQDYCQGPKVLESFKSYVMNHGFSNPGRVGRGGRSGVLSLSCFRWPGFSLGIHLKTKPGSTTHSGVLDFVLN